MNEAIDAFVAAWLRDNEAVLLEIVALQGEDPTTPYGAALAAALAATPGVSRADEYKAHAEEAERRAQTSETPQAQDAYARIAQAWRDLETEARRGV